jgi:hypothetical protein
MKEYNFICHECGNFFCSHECSIKEARITRSKLMAQEDQNQIKLPSLKDFIGKECSVFGKGLGLGKGLLNGEFINQKQYNFIYMGSDDVCHIIQRKVDGEPDGIFFFPKAAVGLRF